MVLEGIHSAKRLLRIINRTKARCIKMSKKGLALCLAAFYHLMLRDASKIMSKAEIIRKARSLSSLFDVPSLKYYSQGIKTSRGGIFRKLCDEWE